MLSSCLETLKTLNHELHTFMNSAALSSQISCAYVFLFNNIAAFAIDNLTKFIFQFNFD